MRGQAIFIGIVVVVVACVSAIAVASPARSGASTVRVPLKNGTHRYTFKVRHSTGARPPLISYSQRPQSANCRISNYGYRAADTSGTFQVKLSCRGVRAGGRASFRFSAPIVRSIPLTNKVGTLDINLDKPPGSVAPLLLLRTNPSQPGKCQARRSRLNVTTHLFHLHIVAECRGLTDGTRGVLTVGGLVQAGSSASQRAPASAAVAPNASVRSAAGIDCSPEQFNIRDCTITLSGFWDTWLLQVDSACPGRKGDLLDWPPKIPNGVASIRVNNNGDGLFTNWTFDKKEITFGIRCS